MNATIQYTQEPCPVIEHWQAATIQAEILDKPIQACWLIVGDKIEVFYWINGKAFIFEQKPAREKNEPN